MSFKEYRRTAETKMGRLGDILEYSPRSILVHQTCGAGCAARTYGVVLRMTRYMCFELGKVYGQHRVASAAGDNAVDE